MLLMTVSTTRPTQRTHPLAGHRGTSSSGVVPDPSTGSPSLCVPTETRIVAPSTSTTGTN